MESVPLPEESFPKELLEPHQSHTGISPKLFFVLFVVIVLVVVAISSVVFYVVQLDRTAMTTTASVDLGVEQEASEWKTYANESLGFSFQYPSRIPGTNPAMVSPLIPYEKGNGGGVGVGELTFFVEKIDLMTAQQWYESEGQSRGGTVTPLLSTSVNTAPAYQFSAHSDVGSMNFNLIEKDSNLYVIHKNINPTIDNEILATFTFL